MNIHHAYPSFLEGQKRIFLQKKNSDWLFFLTAIFTLLGRNLKTVILPTDEIKGIGSNLKILKDVRLPTDSKQPIYSTFLRLKELKIQCR